MKQLILAISLAGLIGLAGLSVSLAKSSLNGEKMTYADASKRWGSTSFASDKFKTGDLQTRASMAANAIKLKPFIGMTTLQVEKELGKHDAYFKNDFIPAYALNEGWKTDEDTWQLVFLPDRDLKIIDVFINKNCCSR